MRHLGKIIRVAWPVVLEMISLNLLELADTYFVGQIGAAQVGVMGFVWSIWGLLWSFPTLVTVGGTVAVAQACGAKTSQAGYVAAMFWLGMALALVLTLVGTLWPATLVGVLQLPAELIPLGAAYLQVRSLGWVPLLLVQCATATWRGRSNTRAAMLVMGAVNLTNITLDAVLIPRLGLVGAAYATLGALAVGLGLAWPVMAEFLRLPRFAPGELAKIGRIGVPAVLEALGEREAFTVFSTVILASLGTLALSGRQISLSILGIAFLPAVGLSVAVTTLVGQQLGAGDVRAARELAWAAAVLGLGGYIVVLGLVLAACWALLRLQPAPGAAIRVGAPPQVEPIDAGAEPRGT